MFEAATTKIPGTGRFNKISSYVNTDESRFHYNPSCKSCCLLFVFNWVGLVNLYVYANNVNIKIVVRNKIMVNDYFQIAKLSNDVLMY